MNLIFGLIWKGAVWFEKCIYATYDLEIESGTECDGLISMEYLELKIRDHIN